MFSQLIAFGAMALALVNAAPTSPLQNALITVSCNTNLNVAPVSNQVHSAGNIESGLYHIYNGALVYGGLYHALRSDGANNPIFVLNDKSSAPLTTWRVEVLDNYGHARIFDTDLNLPLGLSNDWITPLSDSYPETFYLQPNTTSSENRFIIYTSDGNVWSPISQPPPNWKRFNIAPWPRNEHIPSQNWIFEQNNWI
ncbi:hypothetical protein DFH08DRAFT_881991 [Mycena albidolilacea]|uniref:Uncharacterized protein n=1 Tax=Mycena albidolilacea TaxID=1033008 RepID=A0AAD7EK32_9AGAR|nr:hypothetical protein DFH08DRAFT_881991 [Mycena albidolilacea]